MKLTQQYTIGFGVAKTWEVHVTTPTKILTYRGVWLAEIEEGTLLICNDQGRTVFSRKGWVNLNLKQEIE